MSQNHHALRHWAFTYSNLVPEVQHCIRSLGLMWKALGCISLTEEKPNFAWDIDMSIKTSSKRQYNAIFPDFSLEQAWATLEQPWAAPLRRTVSGLSQGYRLYRDGVSNFPIDIGGSAMFLACSYFFRNLSLDVLISMVLIKQKGCMCLTSSLNQVHFERVFVAI